MHFGTRSLASINTVMKPRFDRRQSSDRLLRALGSSISIAIVTAPMAVADRPGTRRFERLPLIAETKLVEEERNSHQVFWCRPIRPISIGRMPRPSSDAVQQIQVVMPIRSCFASSERSWAIATISNHGMISIAECCLSTAYRADARSHQRIDRLMGGQKPVASLRQI